MKTRNLTIPANSSTGPLGWAGNYFHIDDATDKFWLRLGNRALIELEKGKEGDTPNPWDEVEFVNKTDADIDVQIIIGMTDTLSIRSRLLVGDITITSLPALGSGMAALPDVSLVGATAGKLLDSATNTREVHLSADQDIRIGDITNKPGGNAGVYVPAGSVAVISTSAELWAYSVNAATVRLSKVS